jgi:acyl carrier protein
MSAQTGEERELAQLLVQALNLESVAAADIAPEAALFGQAAGSLGLDSIDALEIALAIQQKYKVELRSEDEQTKRAFASLRALSQHVQERRKPA